MPILTLLNVTPLSVDYNGMSYSGLKIKDLTAAAIPADAILDAAKGWLNDQVDAAAERLRIAVLTPGTGQAMEYQEVQSQASAALAAPSAATAGAYPMLAASIGIDVDPNTKAPATDVLGVARAVQAQYQAWVQLGSAIRGTRLKGKAAIAAATTIEAAAAAVDAIGWPALPS